MWTRLVALAALTALLVQCAPRSGHTTPPEQSTSTHLSSTPDAPSPATPLPQAPVVQPVSAEELATTWHLGCPVPPEALRRVELDYWGFDEATHRGELVVDAAITDDVIAAFDQLYALRFPIEKMRTADHYPGADDELSMREDNTSAFNCRDIPGTGRWSLHAYGRAVDINPRVNPEVDSLGAFQPANAGAFVDRTLGEPGMLTDAAPAVRVFTDRGWRWGGRWRTPLDYQHFER